MRPREHEIAELRGADLATNVFHGVRDGVRKLSCVLDPYKFEIFHGQSSRFFVVAKGAGILPAIHFRCLCITFQNHTSARDTHTHTKTRKHTHSRHACNTRTRGRRLTHTHNAQAHVPQRCS